MRTLYALVGAALISVTACSSDDSDQPSSAKFDGTWTSAPYGTTYRIQNQRVEIYEHGRDFCLLSETVDEVTESELAEIFRLSTDGQSLTDPGLYGTSSFHAPTQIYSRAEQLPATCANPLPLVGEAGYVRNPQRDFDVFWQTFDEYYLSFDLKDADWARIREEAVPGISAQSSDADLFSVFYEMITPLGDAHVSIESDTLGSASVDGKPTLIEILLTEYAEANGISLPIPQSQVDEAIAYLENQLGLMDEITLSYASDEADIHTTANGLLLWYSVGDISYLRIGAMRGFSDNPDDHAAELAALESGLDEVMSDIRDQQGLILDVRANNGGSDFLSLAIASRFTDSVRHVYSKQARDGDTRTDLVEVTISPRGETQFLQPIVLLTSASTVSAAEVFTLAMRALPQVSLMGEASQGALSDMLERHLPNGFRFSLSNEFYLSAEGEWFEDVGIPVEHEVAYFTQAQRAEGVDAGLEAAYALLTGDL